MLGVCYAISSSNFKHGWCVYTQHITATCRGWHADECVHALHVALLLLATLCGTPLKAILQHSVDS